MRYDLNESRCFIFFQRQYYFLAESMHAILCRFSTVLEHKTKREDPSFNRHLIDHLTALHPMPDQ
jgi:hypothetical protein